MLVLGNISADVSTIGLNTSKVYVIKVSQKRKSLEKEPEHIMWQKNFSLSTGAIALQYSNIKLHFSIFVLILFSTQIEGQPGWGEHAKVSSWRNGGWTHA